MFDFPNFTKSNSQKLLTFSRFAALIPAKIFSLKVSQRNSQSKMQQRVADFVYDNFCAGQFRREMAHAQLASMNEGVLWLQGNRLFCA